MAHASSRSTHPGSRTLNTVPSVRPGLIHHPPALEYSTSRLALSSTTVYGLPAHTRPRHISRSTTWSLTCQYLVKCPSSRSGKFSLSASSPSTHTDILAHVQLHYRRITEMTIPFPEHEPPVVSPYGPIPMESSRRNLLLHSVPFRNTEPRHLHRLLPFP